MVLASNVLAIASGVKVEVFDFVDSKPRAKFTLEGHEALVTKIAIVAEKDSLISCSNDHTAKVWSLSTGVLKATLRGHGATVSGCYLFHTDPAYCLTVSHDNKCMLWNYCETPFTEQAAKERCEADKKEAEEGETLINYVAGDIASKGEFIGHTAMINTVVISADDRKLFTAGEDSTIRLWNMVGEEKYKITTKCEEGVVDMVLGHHNTLFVATYGNDIEVYSLADCKLMSTYSNHTGSINDVEVSPDGSIVICGSSDGRGSIAQCTDGEVECLATFGKEGGNRMVSVAICPTRYQSLYTDGSFVCVFDLASKEVVKLQPAFTLDVRKVLYSDDGKSILACGDDGQAMIWDNSEDGTYELQTELNKPEVEACGVATRQSSSSTESTTADGGEEEAKVNDEDVAHLMISYNWGHQPIVKKLNQALKDRGYKVWIDIEQMAGSTIGAMATAVDGASAIIMCVSDKYSQSPNCRAEAEYGFTTKKKIIPLMMEPSYRARGWLGFILGAKLWTAFWEELVFEAQLDLLCKELGGLGKVSTKVANPGKASPIPAAAKAPSPEENVKKMGVEEVAGWLLRVTSSQSVSDCAATHEIDGAALLCLQSIAKKDALRATEFVQKSLNCSLGAALRLTQALQAPISPE